MKKMINKTVRNKLITLFTAITLSCSSTGIMAKSSVWKVSKNNDHVFIGGTIHVLPETEYPLPKEFIDAYKNSDQIVLEAQLPDPSDVTAQQAMIAQMSLNNGETLQSILQPKTFELLAHYFSGIGSNIEQFSGFKPGFVISIMALIELQKADISGSGVDAYFEELANNDKKVITYFETAEMQFTMLGDLGRGYEDEFILANIELNAEFADFFQHILDAWRMGDESRLESLINTAAIESDEKSYDALFTHRNKKWIPQIESLFNNNKKEFILVGAGHLFGKDGLIALLKSKGYNVKQEST